MTEIEQAMKDAQAKYLARLTGQPTCCVKVGPDNTPCGRPVAFLTPEEALTTNGEHFSGWYHTEAGQGHHAVPGSYAR